MARPSKQTVDYFPHYVSDGKTKLILQSEFGNDGYAFWYKLLELLCESENQVYDYSNPASWRLLLAKTNVTDDTAIKILQLLADLGTIDPELHKNKVIWSQKLIDNLELVYRRRATGIPERPVSVDMNPPSEVVSVNKSTQTRQDKTRQDKTRQLPEKKRYGEFKNVLLSSEEYRKLEESFNTRLPGMIEALSLGIASKGYKYKSHYAAILSWHRKTEKESKVDGRVQQNRRVPTEYSEPYDS